MIEASDPKGWWTSAAVFISTLKMVLPLIERIFLAGRVGFAMIGTYSTNFGNAAQIAAMLARHAL